MDRTVSRSRKSGSRACVVALLLSIPLLLLLFDIPETTFAGCSSYGGYGCTEVACFGLEVTTDGGYTWKDGTVYIYGTPGSTVLVHTRTLLGAISGSLDGWQFSVRHDASTVTGAGGAFDLVAAQEGNLASVQCGNPPDFEETEIRPCGYIQGVAIDYDSTACTVAAPTDLVTSKACYSVTLPTTTGVYPVTIEFTDDVGDPAIESLVTQDGQTKVPCKFDLTLNVYSTNSYYPTPSYCPHTQEAPVACPPPGGGGGGGLDELPIECRRADFVRGDADLNGTFSFLDGIAILDFLFRAAPAPSCLDTIDANDDERLNVTDALLVLQSFFGGAAPAAPFPNCGPDPTNVDVVDCEIYPPCPVPPQNDPDQDGATTDCENALQINANDPDSDGDDLLDGEEIYEYGTDPASADTDGDGISDGDEVLIHGTDPTFSDTDGDHFTDSQELGFSIVPGCGGPNSGMDISLLGADPLKPDIFVEMDWAEEPGDHDHSFPPESLEMVVQAFAAHGINLHVDAGVPGFDEHGGGGPLPHETNGWNEPVKALGFFDESNRCRVFHYFVSTAVQNEHAVNRIGGQGEIGGDDLWSFNSVVVHPNPEIAIFRYASLFMHELGHNLTLRHGGNDDERFKFNYRSIMNARYRSGVDIDCGGPNCLPSPDGMLDYSDEVLDALDEQNVDESRGICVVDGQCIGPNGDCVPVDFDGDMVCGEEPAVVDLNNNGTTDDIIEGRNDWATLEFYSNSPADIQEEGQGGGGEIAADCPEWP